MAKVATRGSRADRRPDPSAGDRARARVGGPSAGTGTPGATGEAGGQVERLYREHAEAARAFFATGTDQVGAVADVFIASLRAGRTLFFFGNGGSAADAQHLAAEFVNRFARDRPGLPAIALTTDTSVLTSIGNDFSYERVFARQIEALGRAGDVAVGISTSGRSPNVVAALRSARERGLTTVGFTGGDGGPMRTLCDRLILVPSRTTARIQEIHILVGHIVCQMVDDALFPEAG